MNDTATSASGASLLPSTTDVFTAAHLAIIAVLLVLTIVAILHGMRLARRRHRAAQDVERHNAEVDAAPAPTAAIEPPRATAPSDRVAPARPKEPPARESANVTAPDRPAPTAVADPAGEAPVTQLKGLGPKVAARLSELGITTVGDIAALDDAAAARLDEQLGAFRGRMARDRWIEQARLLAAGDRAGFEAAFGRL